MSLSFRCSTNADLSEDRISGQMDAVVHFDCDLVGHCCWFHLCKTPVRLPSHGCCSTLFHQVQSRNATEAIALERFSVFISTRCQPSRRIVAWLGVGNLVDHHRASSLSPAVTDQWGELSPWLRCGQTSS